MLGAYKRAPVVLMQGLGGVAWNDPQPSGQQIRTMFYVTVAGATTTRPFPRGTIPGLTWRREGGTRITQEASPLNQFTTFYVADDWAVSSSGLTPERIRSLVRAKYLASGFTVTGGGSVQVRTPGGDWITPVGTSTPSGPAIAVPSIGLYNEAFDLASALVHLGAAEQSALRHFQQSAGIAADGLYGPQTRSALIRALSSTAEGVSLGSRLPARAQVTTDGSGGASAYDTGGGGGGAGRHDTLVAGQVTEHPSSGSGPWIVAGLVLAVLIGGIVVARR